MPCREVWVLIVSWLGKFISDFSVRRLWKDNAVALFPASWAHQGSLDIDCHLLLGWVVRAKEVRFVTRYMERAEDCRCFGPLGDCPRPAAVRDALRWVWSGQLDVHMCPCLLRDPDELWKIKSDCEERNGKLELASRKQQCGRKGAGPKTSWDGLFSPCVWRTFYSEVFRDHGWTEWSISYSWKKKSIQIHHSPPHISHSYSVLGRLTAHSFIQHLSTELLLYAWGCSIQSPSSHKPYILAGDTDKKQETK